MDEDRISVPLWNPQQGYQQLLQVWQWAKAKLQAGQRLVLELRLEHRSDAQNRTMWSCLRDLSKQVNWHGNKLTDEEWKDVLTAALKRQKVVPGIDGGFVVLGSRTSRMSKSELSDVLELCWSFGSERGVQWSPTSLGERK